MNRQIGLLLVALLMWTGACSDQPSGDLPRSAVDTVTIESDSASLETPVDVAAGAGFDVGWTGPDGKGDYVTVVAKGASKGIHRGYDYTRKGSPLSLTAPDTPGSYEVRYVSGESKETLVVAPLIVGEVSATVEGPDAVGAGGKVEVAWTGPDNKNDYITIVEKGAAEATYGSYTYTRNGSPLELTASETAGEYELRYLMGQSKRVLASAGIEVTAVEASLSVATDAMVEAPIEVTWTGPDNHNDYITVVEAGGPEGTYGDYTYTRKGSPLTVRGPKTPGVFEVRYVTGQAKKVLASQKVTVKPLGATLKVPDQVAPGASLEVSWTGPNNPKDFIAVAKKGAPAVSYESRALSRAGNPAALFAPSSAGSYELRYVLNKGNQILVSVPIKVAVAQ